MPLITISGAFCWLCADRGRERGMKTRGLKCFRRWREKLPKTLMLTTPTLTTPTKKQYFPHFLPPLLTPPSTLTTLKTQQQDRPPHRRGGGKRPSHRDPPRRRRQLRRPRPLVRDPFARGREIQEGGCDRRPPGSRGRFHGPGHQRECDLRLDVLGRGGQRRRADFAFHPCGFAARRRRRLRQKVPF